MCSFKYLLVYSSTFFTLSSFKVSVPVSIVINLVRMSILIFIYGVPLTKSTEHFVLELGFIFISIVSAG